ncbi:MAG: right-handed parallel beta-helix repeat-containing protein [Candidatus Shapirobacteria bacterium]
MKLIISLFFILFWFVASSTNYYIKSSGSDSNSGLSDVLAWQTLTKVNSFNFVAGDSILFERGDSWTGQLTYLKGGSVGSPVVYGSYGTGNKPIISGFQTLSGWTNLGGGVYSCSTSAANTLKLVTLNGVLTAQGRYPNSTYLTFESSVPNTSITDTHLIGGSNWTGAEVVIRTARWKLENKAVTNFNTSTGTFTFTATEETLQNGWGYFIQNDLKTLDQLGEWYCKDGTFYMYFGANSPTSYTVKASVYDDLITISNRTYTVVENIKITGVNGRGININNASSNITIDGCDFEFTGNGAVYLYGSGTISNCSVNHGLNRAFYVEGANSFIQSNTISNVGLMRGHGSIYTGISCIGAGTLIEKNSIVNTGYDGIHFTGNNIIVQKNFVDNFCTILDDGGGVYTGGSTYTGRVIESNIVRNGQSAKDGTNQTSESGFGIYLDEGAANISVIGNTVEKCSHAGILLHFAASVDITNNTVFDCPIQLYLSNNYSSAYADMSNIDIVGNKFVAKTSDQICFKFLSVKNDLAFGSASGNVYARPIDDNQVFSIDTYNTSATAYDLTGWKTLSGYDATSVKSPRVIVDVNDLLLEYNSTANSTIRSIDGSYIDLNSNAYLGSVTIPAYSSALLIKTDNINPNNALKPWTYNGIWIYNGKFLNGN